MNTPRTILVTPVLTTLPRSNNGTAGPRQRYRWRAEFVGAGPAVDGFTDVDEAIGALVRESVLPLQTHDEVIDFVAALFGSGRPADVTIGRAVRIAARHPKRRHAGVRVDLRQPHDCTPVRPVEGGAR